MPQRIGEYRHRVIIQQRTETRDQAGQPEVSWSQFAVRWAKKRDITGSETFHEDALRSGEQMSEVRTHLTRGVGTKMRVLMPADVTTLATTIDGSATTVGVDDATGLPRHGEYRVRIEDELLGVTDGEGTASLTVTRGVDGTTATSHTAGTAVHLMQAHDIEDAHVDWIRGAETVMRVRLSDGVA